MPRRGHFARTGLLVLVGALTGLAAGRYVFSRADPMCQPAAEQGPTKKLVAVPQPLKFREGQSTSAVRLSRNEASRELPDRTGTQSEEDDRPSELEEQKARELVRDGRVAFYDAALAAGGNSGSDSSTIARELESPAANARFPGSEIDDVRCAKTLCRVEAQSENAEAERRLSAELSRTASFMDGQAVFLPELQSDGRIHLTIFASRPGYELPEPEN